MEISFILGVVFMWICLFFARSISNKEIRNLDSEMKAKLVDLATERRSMQIAILVAGIASFYLISYLVDSDRELWFGLYGLFIIGWIIFRLTAAIKKYRELGFSETFVSSQLKAGIVRLVGIAVFFAVFGLNFWLNQNKY